MSHVLGVLFFLSEASVLEIDEEVMEAMDHAWYCILGLLPTSPITTTPTCLGRGRRGNVVDMAAARSVFLLLSEKAACSLVTNDYQAQYRG